MVVGAAAGAGAYLILRSSYCTTKWYALSDNFPSTPKLEH